MTRFAALRSHRSIVADVAAFVLCVAAMLVELARSPKEDPTAFAPVAVVLIASPLLFRHRSPVAAFAAAMVLVFALVAPASVYETIGIPAVLCAYTLAERHGRRAALVAAAVGMPVVVAILQIYSPHGLFTLDMLRNLALVVVPLALGVASHERRAATTALLDRAEAAERTREEEAMRRVGEERLRIARDVHDVVAHAMVAINVQAGVGAHLLDRDPEQARSTLRDIKRVSGEALGDLRSMLGLLRQDDDEADVPVLPTQGLTEIEDLRAGLSSVGIDLDVRIDPAISTVPATVGAAGYRIVQEALTNVMRHAGPTAARVRVTRPGGVARDVVRIEVEDDGGVSPTPLAHTGSGNGLRGMRERAIAVGGSLEAGPRAQGGWRVTAVLPVVGTDDTAGLSVGTAR